METEKAEYAAVEGKGTNRIYHRSPIQSKKSQPEGQRIKPFRHYPLARGLEFLGLHRRPMNDYFS